MLKLSKDAGIKPNSINEYLKIAENTGGLSVCHCGIGRKVLHKRMTNRTISNRVYLTWFLKGNGVLRQDGVEYPLRDFSVCLRSADIPHTVEIVDDEGPRLFLSVTTEFFRFLRILIPELERMPPVWECPFSKETFEAFMNFYDQLKRVSPDEFYLLVPELVRYILLLTGIQHSRIKSPLKNGRRFLEENYSLSLEEIAERCGMNYHTFRRQFTAKYGVSPGKYRIQKRIEAAVRYLEQGVSISDTAELLGYPDVYTFSHQFHSVKGVSPRRYSKE